MRTTIDVPDALYRKTKVTAALRGSTVKDLIIRALEREVTPPKPMTPKKSRLDVPLMKTWKGKKLDLTNFDFDELLP
ncbi:MAG: hypothetical protein ABL995_17100 [Bryobacteraceae bacterium]